MSQHTFVNLVCLVVAFVTYVWAFFFPVTARRIVRLLPLGLAVAFTLVNNVCIFTLVLTSKTLSFLTNLTGDVAVWFYKAADHVIERVTDERIS